MNEAAEFDGRQKTAKVPHLAGVYCESFGTKNEVHVSEAFAFIYVVLPTRHRAIRFCEENPQAIAFSSNDFVVSAFFECGDSQ